MRAQREKVGKEVASSGLGSWRPSMQLPMLAPAFAEGHAGGGGVLKAFSSPGRTQLGPWDPHSRAKAT